MNDMLLWHWRHCRHCGTVGTVDTVTLRHSRHCRHCGVDPVDISTSLTSGYTTLIECWMQENDQEGGNARSVNYAIKWDKAWQRCIRMHPLVLTSRKCVLWWMACYCDTGVDIRGETRSDQDVPCNATQGGYETATHYTGKIRDMCHATLQRKDTSHTTRSVRYRRPRLTLLTAGVGQ